MTFYVNYITYLLVTLMSSVVRYSGHYNLILRTIQYYIPKLLYSIGIQQFLCHPETGKLPYSWHCFYALVTRWSDAGYF